MVQNDILWDENIRRIHLESKLVCTKGVFSIMQIWFDVMKDWNKKNLIMTMTFMANVH
jgi:hypothetical protein